MVRNLPSLLKKSLVTVKIFSIWRIIYKKHKLKLLKKTFMKTSIHIPNIGKNKFFFEEKSLWYNLQNVIKYIHTQAKMKYV